MMLLEIQNERTFWDNYTAIPGITMRMLFCTYLFISILSGSPLYAQPLELNQEAIQQVAQQLGIDPNGRHMSRLLNENGSGSHALERYQNAPILEVIRGKNGTPLPTKEEINERYREQARALKEKYSSEQKAIELNKPARKASRDPSLGELMAKKDFPLCTNSHTKMEKRARSLRGSNVHVGFDMLFIHAKELSNDLREAVGGSVVVRPYDARKTPELLPSMYGLGIRCLPTRLRITGKGSFIHEGRDALKRFPKEEDA